MLTFSKSSSLISLKIEVVGPVSNVVTVSDTPSTVLNLVDSVVFSSTGFMSSVIGFVPSVTGLVPSVTGSVPSVTGSVPSVTGFVPSVTGFVPSVAVLIPSVIGFFSSVGGVLPSVADLVPSVIGLDPLVAIDFPVSSVTGFVVKSASPSSDLENAIKAGASSFNLE